MVKYNYGYDPRELNLTIAGYSGNNEVIVKCPNPEHFDENPSACFNTETGLLYCFSCGFSANHQMLAKNAGLTDIPKRLLPKMVEDKEQLWSDFKRLKIALDNPYLKKRGVSEENVKHFDIRQSNKGVVFLFKDYAEHFVGCQMRQYDKKPKYLTFGKRILFPENHIKGFNPDKPIVLTEGVFGAIRGFNAGFQTLAVIGAMIKRETVEFLNNWNEIIGFFDNDYAGYLAGARLLKFVPRAKIIIPGNETDEISLSEWYLYVTTGDYTRSISQLAELSGEKERFLKGF